MEKEIVTKVCKKCGRELPASEFNKCTSSPDGLQWICRDCQHEYSRKLYEKKQEAKRFSFDKEESPLANFKPRELIAELRARGYKGTLTYTHKIEL